MGFTAKKVLQVAEKEVGYNRWADPKAGTKYGRWYAKDNGPYFARNGVPYCAMFTSWVLNQAGGQMPGGNFAYVPFAIRAARKDNRLISSRNARPGDLVCFDWNRDGVADHIGIITLNTGSYLQTIEGNTSAGAKGSQTNGGGVYRRLRSFNQVTAIIRPVYQTVQKSRAQKIRVDGWFGPATIRATQRVLGVRVDGWIGAQPMSNRKYWPRAGRQWIWRKRNARGSQTIRALQKFLKITPDGYAGRNTVRALQKFLKITPDGYAGVVTVSAFQKWLNTKI